MAKVTLTDTKRTFLDAYANAAVATQSPELKIPAMRTLYEEFIPGDSFVKNALRSAQATEIRKSQYLQDKAAYDATPEDQREEEPKHNISEDNLISLRMLNETVTMFAGKFDKGYNELTVAGAVKYIAEDGTNLPFNIDASQLAALKSDTSVIGNLGENPTAHAMELFRYFKVMGQTHNNIVRATVESELANMVEPETQPQA